MVLSRARNSDGCKRMITYVYYCAYDDPFYRYLLRDKDKVQKRTTVLLPSFFHFSFIT